MKRQNVKKISNMLLPSVLDRVSLFFKLQVFKNKSIYPFLQLLFVTATSELS